MPFAVQPDSIEYLLETCNLRNPLIFDHHHLDLTGWVLYKIMGLF